MMLKRKFCLFAWLLMLPLMVLQAAPIDWSKCPFVQTGVRHYKASVDQPRLMKINIFRVDLKMPGILFVGTQRAEHWGEPMPDYPSLNIRTQRETTVKFMETMRKPVKAGGPGLNVIVAVNTNPWTPWCKPFTHKYAQPSGLVISQGEVVADQKPHASVFVVYKDGKVDIVSEVPEKDYPKVWLACSGFQTILRKGVPDEVSMQERSVHPRTAFGLSADRRFLYLLTVDGRQKDWSIGAELKDLAELLLDAGASDGMNMDGGGSTTLTYFDRKTKKPVTVSRQDPKGVVFRKVSNSIGIALEETPASRNLKP